jgi:hypothetical protein
VIAVVVAEYNKGGATVRFHDDYCKSPEESLEIMKRVERNAYRALVAKRVNEREKKEKEVEKLEEENIKKNSEKNNKDDTA